MIRGLHSYSPDCPICNNDPDIRVLSAHKMTKDAAEPFENPLTRGNVWFHGTDARLRTESPTPFRTLDERKNPPLSHWNSYLGTHFTSHKGVAENFAVDNYGYREDQHRKWNPDQSRVALAQLHMRNPIYFHSESDLDDHFDDWGKSKGMGPLEVTRARMNPKLPQHQEILKEYQKHLRSLGHDGILYGNEEEGPHLHPCAIAFKQTPVTIQRWERVNPSLRWDYKANLSKEAEQWGSHRPADPEYGAPAHELTTNGIYPEDVYTHPHFYGDSSDPEFRKTHRILKSIRGNPEAPVHIYRSLPPKHTEAGFRTGDWISLSQEYARRHGMHPTDPDKDWPVIHAVVPAKHLISSGDSLDEFGYFGAPHRQARLIDEYRADREAQNNRFEQWARGGISHKDVNSPEYQEYFGKGEYEGAGIERRHTYKDWLINHRGPEEGGAHERAYWEGHDMGSRHGEDVENANFDEMEERHRVHPHAERFFEGYMDGFRGMSHTWWNGDQPQRIAVLHNPDGSKRSGIQIVAHVSGNQIDVLHCPMCGSGAVIGRSDGTIECGYCTSVFTVQIQPQYNGMPQSVDGQPYQWPGMPDPAGVAPPDMPEGTNINPNTNGQNDALDPNAAPDSAPPFQSSDPADGGDEDSDEDDDGKPAFLKGKGDKSKDKSKSDDDKDSKKGKNPFAKKKSYRTSKGAELDEANYLAHLAIQFARNKESVARKVKEARRG